MKTTEIEAKLLIQTIQTLPTLPTIYYNLLEVMNNPRSTAIDAAKVIQNDQAAAAKVLKAANSPIYGFYGKIENITQAITYIGFEEVKNFVIAITIIDFFNNNFSKNGIDIVEFWKHSIGVGIISRMIGKYIKARDIENYFLAGILHDIGKITLINLMPDEYFDVYKYSLEMKVSHFDAEEKILGITHNVVGDILATKWNLPVSIRNSIKNHYRGIGDKPNEIIVPATHIANIAAIIFGLGFEKSLPVPEPNKQAWEILELEDNFFSKNHSSITSLYYDTINLLLK